LRNEKVCSFGSLRAWIALAAIVLFLVTSVAVAQAYTTDVTTDKPRYLRGEVVTISGSLLTDPQPGPVQVVVEIDSPSGPNRYPPAQTEPPDYRSWSTAFSLGGADPLGTWYVRARPSLEPSEFSETKSFLVQVLTTATTITTIQETVTGTTTVVTTTSGDLTVPTLVTQLSVTTVTAPTTSTSFLRSYTTSTTTLTVPESTTTASTEVTETSAGASVTVTQIVIIVTQTETYIVETLTSSSTELGTTIILVPGTTETQHGTASQTTYAIETTRTVDYLLVALAFATPALLLAWALILLRRRY